MEAIDAEVLDEGAKRDTKGRRVLPDSEWSRLLDEYGKSGLTQKAFARREGLNLHTLVARLGRRRRNAGGQESAPVRFQEVSLSRSAVPELEVHLPDGLVLRGRSAKDLAELVLALRR